jgi:hypothetical protein
VGAFDEIKDGIVLGEELGSLLGTKDDTEGDPLGKREGYPDGKTVE